MKVIKLRLRILLAEREWEQKDLAEKTGLSTRTISELYNNKTKGFPKEALNKIANAFEIDDMNELFMFVDEEE